MIHACSNNYCPFYGKAWYPFYLSLLCSQLFSGTIGGMRAGWVWLLTLTTGVACADRVIEIPTGRLLYPQFIKAELGILPSDGARERWLINWRVGSYLELHAVRSDRAELAGVQVNLYPEIPNYAPGLSVGIWDLFDRSPEGRGYYLALSYSVPTLGETPLDHDLRFHIGIGLEGMPPLFVGFEIPLTNHLFMLAEHDGRRINAAMVWQPIPQVQLRATLLQNRTSWGLLIQLGEE